MFFTIYHYNGDYHTDTEVYTNSGKFMLGMDDNGYSPRIPFIKMEKMLCQCLGYSQ